MDKQSLITKFSKSAVHSVDIDGDPVYVRVMTVGERSCLEKAVTDKTGKVSSDKFRERLLLFTLSDSQGKRLFADNEEQMISSLSMDIEPAVDLALKVNGFSKDEQETIRKN